MLLHFIIQFGQDHVFYITFIKDLKIICLFALCSSLTKFVSKYYIILFVIISRILYIHFRSLHVILQDLKMSVLHQPFFGMLDSDDFL